MICYKDEIIIKEVNKSIEEIENRIRELEIRNYGHPIDYLTIRTKGMGRSMVNILLELNNIYLYGAGTVASRIMRYCSANGILVNGVIVQDKNNNPNTLLGVPVYSLEEKEDEFPGIDLVLAITGRISIIPELENELFEKNFQSIYIPSEAQRMELLKWDQQHEKSAKQGKQAEITNQLPFTIDYENEFSEQGHVIAVLKDSLQPIFRMEEHEIIDDTSDFLKSANYDDFEELYGRIVYIEHSNRYGYSADCLKEKNVESFVATSHLDSVDVYSLISNGYTPLQVGAALTDIRKGCQIDCEGDHISARNAAYSECTGLYWIYKNVDFSKSKYIGFSQYRRRLVLDDNSMIDIKNRDIDVVLSLPHFSVESVKGFFMRYIPEKDWLLMRQFILEYNPEYRELWEKYEKGHFLFPCNLMLWKSEWLLKYCEFAFSVTDRIYNYYLERNIVRQDRYMGYIFENLTSFFAMAHKDEMKIGYTEVVWIKQD